MANVAVYLPQGGAELVVGSGGAVTVESGGEITVASGGTVDLGAGVTLTVAGTNIVITGLPTSDPSVAGALWTNSNVLTLSAG
jgi:hypothetical protein